MDDLRAEGLEYKRELLEMHKRRLHELEKQKAQYGIDAPPHVVLEIEDIRREIAGLELEKERVWRGEYLEVAWGKINDVEKDDVAVVVDISRPIRADVERFLQTKGIGADIAVISMISGQRDLEGSKEEWEGIVAEFFPGLSAILDKIRAKRIHIFLSAPANLAFAMGCLLGTHYDVHLYQWIPNLRSYQEIITVRRGLFFSLSK